MTDWFIELSYEGQLATWLVASFILYILASQVAWHSNWVVARGFFSGSATGRSLAHERYPRREDGLGYLVDRLRDHSLAPWGEEILRLVYFLGLPFMAAINGWLGDDLMGINGTDWLDGQNARGFLWEEWVQGLGLAATVVLAVMAVWFAGRLISRKAGLTPLPRGLPGPLWGRLLDVLYCQIHWAFYRSGPILWLGDLYWGTFVGLALVLAETAFNPAFWWSLKSPETAGPPLIRLGMAWISALLFLATQNLWLTVGAHLVLIGLLGGGAMDSYSFVDDASVDDASP